jgi:hypothetical protein
MKMKKRRVRDFLLAGSLILGMMLTGCGMSGQQTEQNGGKEQNTEENYITFSNNINYIESFNEIFEEYRKQNEADK